MLLAPDGLHPGGVAFSHVSKEILFKVLGGVIQGIAFAFPVFTHDGCLLQHAQRGKAVAGAVVIGVGHLGGFHAEEKNRFS